MAINVKDYIIGPQEFEGLDRMGARAEKRKLQEMEFAQQREAKKAATANFLRQYLDPKDYLSGTAYDPVAVEGLNKLMEEGSALAAQGVDNTGLLMALSKGVNKIATYSAKAKAVQKNIDDQIARIKETGAEGLDLAALKSEAQKNAFFDVDEKGGQKFNIDKADPSTNWVGQVLEKTPELVSNAEGLDAYVKKAQQFTDMADVTTYTPQGTRNRQKTKFTGPAWTMPDVDAMGTVTGMVPRYDLAFDGDAPVMDILKDESGNEIGTEQVRLLQEPYFDQMMKSSMGNNAFFRGQINRAIKDYETNRGEKISIDSPEAKRLARAVAYKELAKRQGKGMEYVQEKGKPSTYEQAYNVKSSDPWARMLYRNAAAVKEGRESVQTDEDRDKAAKKNVIQAFGEIVGGNPDYLNGPRATIKGRNVIDVTGMMPGGGIKKGRGMDETFKGTYYDPITSEFHFEVDVPGTFGKKREVVTKSEAEWGPFMYDIAEANGINRSQVRDFFDQIGYKGGKFTKRGGEGVARELAALPDPVKEKALQSFEKEGSTRSLNKAFKGKKIGDQEVMDIDTKFWGKGKYEMELKGPDGKTQTKTFNNKEELTNFLKQGSKSAAAPKQQNTAHPPKRYKGVVYEWDDKINNYAPRK